MRTRKLVVALVGLLAVTCCAMLLSRAETRAATTRPAQSRLSAARGTYELILQQRRQGEVRRSNPEEMYRRSRRWTEAERDSATDDRAPDALPRKAICNG